MWYKYFFVLYIVCLFCASKHSPNEGERLNILLSHITQPTFPSPDLSHLCYCSSGPLSLSWAETADHAKFLRQHWNWRAQKWKVSIALPRATQLLFENTYKYNMAVKIYIFLINSFITFLSPKSELYTKRNIRCCYFHLFELLLVWKACWEWEEKL